MNEGLTADNIACVRGGRLVFADLDLSVPKGTALVLNGPNGAGKSSLLRVLAGLIRPVVGTISWEGEDIADLAEDFRGSLHYVGHSDPVKPALTVRENLKFWAGMLGSRDPVDNALAAMGLRPLADMPARYLSQGQRRRLNLARLVVEGRPIWLLDEPTVGLDAASIARLEMLLDTHLSTGGVAVIATHAALGGSKGARVTFDLSVELARAEGA